MFGIQIESYSSYLCVTGSNTADVVLHRYQIVIYPVYSLCTMVDDLSEVTALTKSKASKLCVNHV